MTLFDSARHERLTETRWSEATARTAIERITTATHEAYEGPHGLWPLHPLDASPERADRLKPIYYGAAGVIWALHYLQDRGFAAVGRDYLPVFTSLLDAHRADAVRLGQNLAADAGILHMHYKLAPSNSIADEMYRTCEANLGSSMLSTIMGSAGTMLHTLFMHERCAAPRWKELYARYFEDLSQRWLFDAELGCHVWLTNVHGREERHIGSLHGAPGAIHAMLRGAALLTAAERRMVAARARRLMSATAVRCGIHVNWPLVAGPVDEPRLQPLLLQHCWGAPGFVNCLSALPPDEQVDAMLLGAGELAWQAGPIAKLPGLCHGAPAAGYAFLKLHTRTGDGTWLGRARAFAMHGIQQADAALHHHGQRKFSLWTGDLGLACFLVACVEGSSEMPTLDFF